MQQVYSKIKYIISLLLIFFIIDRTIKYLALNKLPCRGVYLFKYLQFQLQTNSGIAFGISLPQALIIALTMIIIIFLFYYLLRNIKREKYLNTFLLGLVIIGAISNLIDRIFYKEVVDFIQIGIWPNFNLADAYISIGIVAFLIANIKKDPKSLYGLLIYTINNYYSLLNKFP